MKKEFASGLFVYKKIQLDRLKVFSCKIGQLISTNIFLIFRHCVAFWLGKYINVYGSRKEIIICNFLGYMFTYYGSTKSQIFTIENQLIQSLIEHNTKQM